MLKTPSLIVEMLHFCKRLGVTCKMAVVLTVV